MPSSDTNRREFLRVLMGSAVGLSLTYSAFGQAGATPDAIKATKLTDRLVLFSGDGGNVVVVIGDDGLMMIDGGLPNRSADLLKAISDVDSHKVRVLFDTHWHFDHVGSNETVGRSGAKIIAHENVKTRLSSGVVSEALNIMQSAPLDRKQGPLQPEGIPSETFTKDGKLTFGKEKIEYTHIPLAHTDGDTYLFFPNANVLHTGDLLFNRMYPVIDYSTGGWIGGMAAACERLLKVGDDKTQIVPGHGPLASKEDLKASRDMLHTVQQRLEAMSKQGKSRDEVVASQPTKDLDDKWGKPRPPEVFLRMAYPSLAAHKQQA
jgi:cyclase